MARPPLSWQFSDFSDDTAGTTNLSWSASRSHLGRNYRHNIMLDSVAGDEESGTQPHYRVIASSWQGHDRLPGSIQHTRTFTSPDLGRAVAWGMSAQPRMDEFDTPNARRQVGSAAPTFEVNTRKKRGAKISSDVDLDTPPGYKP